MKKNNFTFLIILFLAVGCSKHSPESLLTKWEKTIEKDIPLERKFASSGEGQCFKSLFTVETLRSEIKALEKKITSKDKVKGSWKHLSLASLPLAQANFLKSYGEKLGDLKNKESIDFSSCSDVPCIFNKIYGKEDHVAGYVHYLWYLKLGHLLSADNMVPDQKSKIAGFYNDKEFPLSAYLYSDKELFGLWRLTHMLKAPHTTLKYLTEVQRIPRGEAFEGRPSNVCGLASSAGWILLNDGCLSVSEGRQDTGYLYQAVTHEINHQIDYQEGRGTSSFYRSEKKDYLDVSGLYLKEYVDAAGKQVRQWAHQPGIKLISSYAGTSPAENFAESLALYRVDGDHSKRAITDAHYKFVSKEYYQNRVFEKDALFKGWIKDYESDIGKSVFKAVVDCSTNKEVSKSTYFRASDFSSPTMPGMVSCLGASAVEISNDFKTKISLYEPDGCLAMTDYTHKGKWDINIKDHLRGAFDKYLSDLQSDKDYLARIQNYYSELNDKTLARESYIRCYAEENEETCFNAEVYKEAHKKAEILRLSPDQTKEMAEMYVSFHSFDKIKEETEKSYKAFVSSHQEIIRDEAEKVWDGCSAINQNDDESPTGRIFTVGDGYMISSMYNCLNATIPEGVKHAVRSLEVDGFTLQNAKEEIILSKEVRPSMVTMLQEMYRTQKDLELKRSLEAIEKDNGNVRKELLSDFSWITNVLSTDKIQSDCKIEGYKKLSFNPLYHLNSDLFGEYMSTRCRGISETKEFTEWLNNSKELFNDKVSTGLESKITEAGFMRADACLKDFPMDSAINKIRYRKQREACLIDEWPKLEEKILTEAMSDPLVIKFQMSKESLKEKLETNRRRLQVRIIKEKFN